MLGKADTTPLAEPAAHPIRVMQQTTTRAKVDKHLGTNQRGLVYGNFGGNRLSR